jgi:hypothetical protein
MVNAEMDLMSGVSLYWQFGLLLRIIDLLQQHLVKLALTLPVSHLSLVVKSVYSYICLMSIT